MFAGIAMEERDPDKQFGILLTFYFHRSPKHQAIALRSDL